MTQPDSVHELVLMQSVVDAVTEQIAGRRVLTVRLEIGRLTCVDPEALRFCFDVCVRDTVLAGSTLDIVEIPGRGRCRRCRVERAMEHVVEHCPCGGVELDIVSGRQLRLKEVEVI